VNPPRRRGLAVALGVVTAGVMVQAVLAGLFLSGEATRTAHTVVGWVLPWFAFVPAVLAVRRRSWLRAPVWVGAAALPVLLWVQEVLGHVPWSGSTAVHVPLGVLLFGGSWVLTGAAARDARGVRAPSLHPVDASVA
jgi:hypothetical protein